MRFVYKVGVEPTAYSLTENHSTIELFATYYDVLPQLLYTLLDTEYNTPRTFCLADYSVMFHDQCLRLTTQPPTINIAYKPLGATLRTNTLPFLIPIDKLVLYGSQHHLLLFTHPGSLRPVDMRSSPYTCFIVTSTGLISERYLAVVSRLA